ncbi:polyprenyl synthetase family protein [Patescibacteria group bacterium]
MLEFIQSIKKHRKDVNGRLRQLFHEKQKQADPELKPTYKRLERYTMSGGKRLRAYLVNMGAAFVDKEISKKNLLDLGASLELGHTGILVHDDIIDRDLLRRGEPTLHIASQDWRNDTKRPKKQLGYLNAMTCGNILGAWANEILMNTDLTDSRKLLLLEVATRTGLLTAQGEVYDIQLGAGKRPDLDWTELLAIQQLKTAPYSFEGPLVFGALAAGGSKAAFEALAEYSNLVGSAFQLQDDILGIQGNKGNQKIGKTPAADLREGKLTPLIKIAMQESGQAGKKKLTQLLEKPSRNSADINQMKRVIENSNAYDIVADVAGKKVKLAEKWTRQNITDQETRALFTAVARFVLNRKF